MTFKIGMPVKCVNNGLLGLNASPWLTVGAVYVIEKINLSHQGFEYLHLVGIPLGWRSSRFRPAVSPGISFDETIRAPLDSEQWDNRKRVDEPAWGAVS